MNFITRYIQRRKEAKAHREQTERDATVQAARQMMQDAFAAFGDTRAARRAARLLLASYQTSDQNDRTSNWFGMLAHDQQKDTL